ncbi:MAG: Nif3-like dinuclear metal center hexameric protein [Desulfomonilaceae bacterium]
MEMVTGQCLSGIVEIANRLFPFDTAEPWDNCGIQIGDPNRRVSSIAFSLDPTPQTIKFATASSCELLISHHPLILQPLRNIISDSLFGRVVLDAARMGVDILSLHTNLDAAAGGLNDQLAYKLGLENIITPIGARCARIGQLPSATTVFSFARKIAKDLEISQVRVVSAEDAEVRTVFCASGSGMSYLSEALRENVDLMVTGDVRYHPAREALEMGMPVIDAGHFGLEKGAINLMRTAFEAEFARLGLAINCINCELEKEPFIEICNP